MSILIVIMNNDDHAYNDNDDYFLYDDDGGDDDLSLDFFIYVNNISHELSYIVLILSVISHMS